MFFYFPSASYMGDDTVLDKARGVTVDHSGLYC